MADVQRPMVAMPPLGAGQRIRMGQSVHRQLIRVFQRRTRIMTAACACNWH